MQAFCYALQSRGITPALVALALVASGGCRTPGVVGRVSTPSAGPISPWPRPIPIRVAPPGRDDLFVMTLGDVQTPLADGSYDPVADRVTLHDGTVIEDYYKKHLDVAFYRPIDKSVFPVPPSGWCSWYYYYQEITPQEVLHNARWIAEHLAQYGCRYVQLDDGWQGVGHGVGENRDWTTIDKRFRDLGMAGLAREICKLGLQAGLWIAPHGQSNEQVARESGAFTWKPDGKSASETWEGNFLVDPSVPQAHDYLYKLFKSLRDSGYTYFKIDGQPIVIDEYKSKREFMKGVRNPGGMVARGGMVAAVGDHVNVETSSPSAWLPTAAAMPPDENTAHNAVAHGPFEDDPSKLQTPNSKLEPPEELYRGTLRTIRRAIGNDSYLLGCWGIPLPGVGIMNGSRTAGDVVPGWDGFLVAADAVQQWNFLHNITWYCDPDVCTVRPPLTDGMARCWATIQGLTGQALLTSDRLPDLPASRVELLKRIYPATDIRPLDLFKPEGTRKAIWNLKVVQPLDKQGRAYDVVGIFNFDDRRANTRYLAWKQLGLDPGKSYHVFDYWQQSYLGAWEAGVFLEVPPADVRVITLVEMTDRPVLVSTSRHITQGWTELKALRTLDRHGNALAGVAGLSQLVGNDAYSITIGLPRSGRLRLSGVKANRDAKKLSVRCDASQGSATVQFESPHPQELEWMLQFEETQPYIFPVTAPNTLSVTPDGLADAVVTWPCEYNSKAGYRVELDGQPLGVAFHTRAVLRDLTPGRTYKVGVRSVWYDGSVSKNIAETDYAPRVPDTLYLSDVEPESSKQDWGSLGRDRSCDGNALTVAGQSAAKGLGTHAESRLRYRLYGAFAKFEARVGPDDEAKAPRPAEVLFQVFGDGKLMWQSGTMKPGDAPRPVSLDIAGVQMLELRVLPTEDGKDYDHADWLEARVLAR